MNLAGNHNQTPETAPAVPQPEISANEAENQEAGLEGGIERGPQPERPGERPPVKETEPAQSVQPVPALPTEPTVPAKDAYHQRVERVLEDDLIDLYVSMPKETRQAFRQEGERVASRLRQMIDQAGLKAKEVLKVIRGWLRMIPGINRWFLEQEAKIKTDRIISLAEDRRREKENEI